MTLPLSLLNEVACKESMSNRAYHASHAPGRRKPDRGMLLCALALLGALTMATAATAADEANPFSDTKPDPQNEQLHQQLSAMDERMRQVESRVSAIQQLQVAVPAAALTPVTGKASAAGAGAGTAADDDSVELQTATFIACVNGKAMFRDSDQKPFFVSARDASQNDAVRRLGGCKP